MALSFYWMRLNYYFALWVDDRVRAFIKWGVVVVGASYGTSMLACTIRIPAIVDAAAARKNNMRRYDIVG